MDTLISVIVCTYNQEDTIGRTLDSILNQDCRFPFEIVVGEDCSTDRTLAVCREYERRYPDRVRVIANNPNKGILDNYFDCLFECRGSYIADCAGDDFWIDSHKLQTECELLEVHPDVGIVHTNWQYYNEKDKTVKEAPCSLFAEGIVDGKEYLEAILTQTCRPAIHLCTSMYRADWIRQAHNDHVDFFRNKIYPCEDVQVAFFLARMGKVAYLPQVTLNYSWGGESISNSVNMEKQYKFYSRATRLVYDLTQKEYTMTPRIYAFLQERFYGLMMFGFRARNKEMRDEALAMQKEFSVGSDARLHAVSLATSNSFSWNALLLVRRLYVSVKACLQCLLVLAVMLSFSLDASCQFAKMSPFVRQTLAENGLFQNSGKGARRLQSKFAEREMCVLVRSASRDVFASYDAKVLDAFGDIYVVRVPLSNITSLALADEVSRIEAGRPCKVQLDTLCHMVGADRVWNYSPDVPQSDDLLSAFGITGKGVVLGIMDIGFDLTHPTFYSSDMQDYRIKSFWDMIDCTSGGNAVTGLDTTYVGRQYTDRESLLSKQHSYDAFLSQHGTHTLGIAAGSGAPMFQADGSPLFRGIAFDSDLCLVSNATASDADSIPEEMQSLYTTALDLLGFKYIFDYAERHSMPCVISFSEGSRPDFYGQDVLYREALSSMFGKGRIMVASAGNDGASYTYFRKPKGVECAGGFVDPQSSQAFYTFRSSGGIGCRLTFYQDGKKVLTYEKSTEELCAMPDSMSMDTLNVAGVDHLVLMATYHSCYNPDDFATELYLLALDGSVVGRSLPVSVSLFGEQTDAEMFSLGGHFALNALDKELNQIERTHNINNPSAFDDVICVGSINSRQKITNFKGSNVVVNWGEIGEYSGFSSVGPTIDGLLKPDVMAPGCSVYSAGSSWYLENNPDDWSIIRKFGAEGRNYSWVTNCGTSMSAPVVAGVVALWLQVCPTLTPSQVLDVISKTSHRPESDLSYPNPYYGYGVIDAAAGVEYIMENMADVIRDVRCPDADTPHDHVYDLSGRRVNALRSGTLYIRKGKKFIQR